MKKEFSKEYMQQHCGCYSIEKMESIFFVKGNSTITIEDIVNSEIPLKDKYWFVYKKTKLTKQQNQHIAISLAEIVLPIYEKRYPNDVRPKEAIEAAKLFITGHISIDILMGKKRADAAAAAVDAYADAATAAYAAAAYAYVAAANAAYAYDAYAYAYVAAAADDAIKNKIFAFLVDFVKNN